MIDAGNERGAGDFGGEDGAGSEHGVSAGEEIEGEEFDGEEREAGDEKEHEGGVRRERGDPEFELVEKRKTADPGIDFREPPEDLFNANDEGGEREQRRGEESFERAAHFFECIWRGCGYSGGV